jgi:hypothetical protein
MVYLRMFALSSYPFSRFMRNETVCVFRGKTAQKPIMASEEPWRLYYWPGFPGRGEFVRLVFEDCKVPYIDVGRAEGFEKVRDFVYARQDGLPVAAPPVIQRQNVILSQSMNICMYLAEKYGALPQGVQFPFSLNFKLFF